jgi:quercetin dioxygenase-like cupin family protein
MERDMDKRQAIAITEEVSDRTPRPLSAPLLSFDFAHEAELLRAEELWSSHGHNARTLIKFPEFRLVLMVLRAGSHRKERESEHRVALHVLEGRLRLHVPTEDVELAGNQLLALDRDIPCEMQALEDSAFLLWVGWSQS